MSVVEDVRKGIQDVLAPDIKAIDARLTVLDAAVKAGLASAERVAAARHELILADSRHDAIVKALDIDKRLEKLEGKQAVSAVA